MSRIGAQIFPDAQSLGVAFATRLLAQIDEARDAGRRFLLGCPGGRSPRPVYQAMGRLLAKEPRFLGHVTIVMMDDYLYRTERGFEPVPIESHFSCRRFARDEIIGVLNAGLAETDRIPWEHVWFPDPRKPEVYDSRIEDAGGIDVFILASGASDGHIAFNPAGSARDSRSRNVPLAEETRLDNMATFPAFRSIDDVPSSGVTVGIDTICRHSKAAVMIVWGQGKRKAFSRLTAAQRYEPDWPATIVAECRNGEILADQQAAGA